MHVCWAETMMTEWPKCNRETNVQLLECFLYWMGDEGTTITATLFSTDARWQQSLLSPQHRAWGNYWAVGTHGAQGGCWTKCDAGTLECLLVICILHHRESKRPTWHHKVCQQALVHLQTHIEGMAERQVKQEEKGGEEINKFLLSMTDLTCAWLAYMGW